MRSARDRLIVALDVPSAEEARALIEALGDSVGVYKIGLELMFAGGMGLATELATRGSRVFLDAKLNDIEATVERATASIARTGAEFLTVHAFDRKKRDAGVPGRGDRLAARAGVGGLGGAGGGGVRAGIVRGRLPRFVGHRVAAGGQQDEAEQHRTQRVQAHGGYRSRRGCGRHVPTSHYSVDAAWARKVALLRRSRHCAPIERRLWACPRPSPTPLT